MKEGDGERQNFPEISEDSFPAPDEGFSDSEDSMLDGTPVPSDEDIFTEILETPDQN